MTTQSAPLDILQRWMLSALVAPDRTERQSVAELVLPGAQLDAAACLAIYQRSYILRLRKCLAEQFPATRHALGDELFNDFADEYLRACPPDSYTLYELGRRFPQWLEQNRIDADRTEDEREGWIDFMVDLAHYERELFRLFDAPGHEEQPWPDIQTDDSALILQSCLVLTQYRYQVAWYYHEVRAERSPRFPPKSASHMVILRRDYQTTTYPVSPLHYRFLCLLQQHNIAYALADIAQWTGQPLAVVTNSWTNEVRRSWIEAGFFVERASA